MGEEYAGEREDDTLGEAAARLVDGLRSLSLQAARFITKASNTKLGEHGWRFDPRSLKGATKLPPNLEDLYRMDQGLAIAVCSAELIRRIGLRGAAASVIAQSDTEIDWSGPDFARDELPLMLEPAQWLETLLCAQEASYWDSMLFQIDQEAERYEWKLEALADRPWSELLRCWTEGFKPVERSVNKREVPTWTEYLESNAGVLAMDCVASRETLKLVCANTLLTRYKEARKRSEESQSPLFKCQRGLPLPEPSRGRHRKDLPLPQRYEVYAWICDGEDDAHPDIYQRVFTNELHHPGEFRVYRPEVPDCASSWPTDHTAGELERISQDGRLRLPDTATRWDRRPCIDYRRCGGVLVPASKTGIEHILSLSPTEKNIAGEIRRLLNAQPDGLF